MKKIIYILAALACVLACDKPTPAPEISGLEEEISINDWENDPLELIDPGTLVASLDVNVCYVEDVYPQYAEQYPSTSYLYVQIKTKDFAGGYYGLWTASSWDVDSELCDTETAWKSMTTYGSNIADEADFVDDLKNKGESNILFSGLTPGVAYIFIICVEDSKGNRAYQYVVKSTATEGGGESSLTPYTSITEDVDLTSEFTGGSGEMTNYGDYYEIGAENWEVYVYNSALTQHIRLDLNAPASATTIEGEYTISATAASGSVVAGGVDDDGFIYPSYFGAYDNDLGAPDEPLATLYSGTVKITTSGDNYAFDIDAADCVGNKLVGTFTVALENVEPEIAVASCTKAHSSVKGKVSLKGTSCKVKKTCKEILFK